MESSRETDWTAWLDRHGPALVLFARQWAHSQADAEDIVQEAFVRFWRARHQARRDVPYLYACVRTSALDWLRSRRRRGQREMEAAIARSVSAEPVFENSPETAELRSLIERTLSQLAEEQREVLVMKIWGGLTFQEIGEALDISQNTAASRYRYAVDALRRKSEEFSRNG